MRSLLPKLHLYCSSRELQMARLLTQGSHMFSPPDLPRTSSRTPSALQLHWTRVPTPRTAQPMCIFVPCNVFSFYYNRGHSRCEDLKDGMFARTLDRREERGWMAVVRSFCGL